MSSNEFDQDYRDEIAAMGDDDLRRFAFTMQKSYDEIVAAAERAIESIDSFGDAFLRYHQDVLALKDTVMYGDRHG